MTIKIVYEDSDGVHIAEHEEGIALDFIRADRTQEIEFVRVINSEDEVMRTYNKDNVIWYE